MFDGGSSLRLPLPSVASLAIVTETRPPTPPQHTLPNGGSRIPPRESEKTAMGSCGGRVGVLLMLAGLGVVAFAQPELNDAMVRTGRAW